MAKLDFPVPTTVGEIHTQNDKSWRWTGVSWESAGDGGDTIVATSSADWNSAYTTVQSASGDWTVKDLGTFNNDSSAEAAMTYDGFYTWCKTLDGNPACSMLSCKRDTVIFHVSQFSHGETFIVGDQPGDHFTSFKTAIQYVQYLKIRDSAVIIIEIRPGEYEFSSSLDISHDNGDNIFIRPLDGSPSVTYPKSTDFTGVSADDLDMLKGKYSVKFKFTSPSDQINSFNVPFGTARIEDILIYKETESITRAVSVTEQGKFYSTGCSFFGFGNGIQAVNGSYLRIFDTSVSYITEDAVDGAGGAGIKVNATSQLLGRRNTIYKCDNYGLQVSTDSMGTWYESVIEECGKGPLATLSDAISITDHSTLISPRAGTLSGNIIKNCDSGIFLSQSSVARIGDLTCIDSDRWNIRSSSDSNLYLFDPISLSGSGVGFEDIEVEDGGAVSFTNDVNNILGSTTYSSPLNVIDTDGSIIKDNSQPIQSIENWDSTYTTVSANSASWGVDTGGVGTSVTRQATFTNSNNRIEMVEATPFAGFEIGDVIEVTNSLSNDNVYTIESFPSVQQVIVNAAHAGGSSSKSLTTEILTAGVTITLVCKGKNAPLGLGQGWANVSRAANTFATNSTGRTIMVSINAKATTVSGYVLINDENSSIIDIDQTGGGSTYNLCVQMAVPDGQQYKYQLFLANREAERELR